MEINILFDIAIIFALSTLVNFIFSKINFPTAVGYLLTGIVVGPHMLSLIHATHEIDILAEIGVILLLFSIGMEFSLKHLMRIRKIVFIGGFIQVALTVAVFYFVSLFHEINWKTGLFIGFLTALSSSALVLKILQERSELTSNYGRTVLGILIFQDLLVVPLLLFTNFIGNPEANVSYELLLLLLKTSVIIGLVFVGNRWFLPWLLHIVALTKNQELFVMSLLLICLSIALFTSWLGMSLAFGAFLAGIMISESHYSHNAFGNLIPFKDLFTSFFFVSIGMLLDVSFVSANLEMVLWSVLLVVIIKMIIAGGTGFLMGHTFRGTIMIGLALSQVGEFSFILAKIGFNLQIIHHYFYQLFLAVAVITMALTPLFMKISNSLALLLMKLPIPKTLEKGLFPLQEVSIPSMQNHLVIIGKDASALKLSRMATLNNIAHVSIVFDPTEVKDKMNNGDMVVYGDAINLPILHKAYVEYAETVVISVGDEIASLAIVSKVRNLNKKAHIIVRVKYLKNIEDFYNIGADQVLPEKLEIALDMFNRILLNRLYPQNEITKILNEIRNRKLGEFSEKDIVNKNRTSIIDQLPNTNIIAITIEQNCCAQNKSLSTIELRKKTGATLLAIKKDSGNFENPSLDTIFECNDIVYLLGSPNQIFEATKFFTCSTVL